MDNVCIRGRRGTLHFIRFPTSEMGNFLALAKSKGMANLVTTVCATGGGAFKFEDNFKKVLDHYFRYTVVIVATEIISQYNRNISFSFSLLFRK